ncbi:MAG TPA: acyl-CoA dehydrogenase family protein [Cellulomonadaceae bacterium]|nr:acyl-CoA dehydrogenase family protein [Cellulomonadaceae bacterium]
MQLEFTSEQEDLRDSVRVVLERECPMTLVRAVVETGVAPDALWKHMVELGWTALTVPGSAGGLGLGPVELAVVVEELGRVVAPGPFLATATQFTSAVREAGDDTQQQRFLGPIVEGTATGALAITEPGVAADPIAVRAQAARSNGTWTLLGSKTFVLDGDTADEIVVVAREPGTVGEDGVVALVTPRDALNVTPRQPLDPTRSLVDLDLDGAQVPDDRRLGDPGPHTVLALRRAIEEATAMLAVEIVGTSQAILDVTLDYAKQREQFGVPIGSFQAIKHKFADMLIALERARATAYFAALCVAEDDPRRAIAVATAKAAAGDCQRRFGKEGIQILGGIGYTWEHDMHLYVRRIKTDAQLLGTAHEHRRRIAELLGL